MAHAKSVKSTPQLDYGPGLVSWFKLEQHCRVGLKLFSESSSDIQVQSFGPDRYALIRYQEKKDEQFEKYKSVKSRPLGRDKIENVHKQVLKLVKCGDATVRNALKFPEVDDFQALVLHGLASQSLAALRVRASKGDEEAIDSLLDVIVETVNWIESIASKDPALMKRSARHRIVWPMLCSVHSRLRRNPGTFLAGLELGKALPMSLDPLSKWKVDPASGIAVDLLEYISNLRAISKVRRCDEYGTFGEAARSLPEFDNKDSAEKWWELAKALLLKTYQNPERLPEFSELVTAKTHRSSPGRMKQRILRIIQDRFISLAPKLTR